MLKKTCTKIAYKSSAPFGSSLAETVSTLRWCGAAHQLLQLKHVSPAAKAVKGLRCLCFASGVCAEFILRKGRIKISRAPVGLLPADGGKTELE